MNVSQVLFKAAQIIERDGWCKHVAIDEEGRMCAGGAIAQVQNGNAINWMGEAEITMAKFMRFIEGRTPEYPAGSISRWNNEAERIAEEVIDMLVIASIEAKS